jgi:hypothetical protein
VQLCSPPPAGPLWAHCGPWAGVPDPLGSPPPPGDPQACANRRNHPSTTQLSPRSVLAPGAAQLACGRSRDLQTRTTVRTSLALPGYASRYSCAPPANGAALHPRSTIGTRPRPPKMRVSHLSRRSRPAPLNLAYNVNHGITLGFGSSLLGELADSRIADVGPEVNQLLGG